MALVGVLVAVSVGHSGGSSELLPAPVGTGTPLAQAAVPTVPDTSGIAGVVAYDTAGYPGTSGPVKGALPHNHVPGRVAYSVTPPVGGDHNAVWMTCGVYNQPVPAERAVHDMEHGAVWITYQPTAPHADVVALRALEARQTVVSGSRYVDLTPFPGLPAAIVASAWGHQLRVSSAGDPRLQQFIDRFRVSKQYTPEYGSSCTGGVGTPSQS